MTLGAVEVAVLPVGKTVPDLQEFPVLLVPLVGIAGETAENGPDHETIAQRPENQIHGLHPDIMDRMLATRPVHRITIFSLSVP